MPRTSPPAQGLSDSWWKGWQIGGSNLVGFRADAPRAAAAERLGLPVVAVGHP